MADHLHALRIVGNQVARWMAFLDVKTLGSKSTEVNQPESSLVMPEFILSIHFELFAVNASNVLRAEVLGSSVSILISESKE